MSALCTNGTSHGPASFRQRCGTCMPRKYIAWLPVCYVWDCSRLPGTGTAVSVQYLARCCPLSCFGNGWAGARGTLLVCSGLISRDFFQVSEFRSPAVRIVLPPQSWACPSRARTLATVPCIYFGRVRVCDGKGHEAACRLLVPFSEGIGFWVNFSENTYNTNKEPPREY